MKSRINPYALVSVMIVSLFAAGCSEEKIEKEVIRPVRYQQVYLTGGDRLRIFSGTAKAGVESNLSFKVAGTVENVYVKVGDNVKRGQMLAQLDDTDFKLQFQEADAAMKQSISQEINAKSNYERVRQLYENRSAAKRDLEQARSQYESASATVERQQNMKELAQLQLSYTRLTAPLSGTIGSRKVEVNENVQAGTPIFLITSKGKPEVSISVPEVLIANVQRGHEVDIRFDAIQGKDYNGIVAEVGLSSGQYSTTYPVVVTIGNPDEKIRPGMAADVIINFRDSNIDDKITVPPACVGEDEGGNYIFIAIPTEEGFGIVKKQQVTIGTLTSEGLEITDGLADGELVVTAGISRIKDGQKVKLLGL
jgi:RND family efflux transporter MFP subunit